MSECVVRMEIPSKDRMCQMADDIDGVWYCPVMKKLCRQPDNWEMPSWCPIICELPQGHGRLVDKDEMLKKVENYHRYMTIGRESDPRCIIEDSPAIVPAEAERSET